MRIHPISDLHLEHHNKFDYILENLPIADVYTIAGDFKDGIKNYQKDMERFFEKVKILNRKAHIIHILGNHDYYGTDTEKPFDVCLDLSNYLGSQYYHFLHWRFPNIKIGDVSFFGDTLWFPNRADTELLSSNLSDFQCIRNFRGWHQYQNTRTEGNIIQVINNIIYTQNKKLCIVTHHIPDQSLVHSNYQGDPLNIFFVGSDNLHKHMGNEKLLWIFGHSHNFTDKMLGDTRCICNPIGYNPLNSEYQKNLIIDF